MSKTILTASVSWTALTTQQQLWTWLSQLWTDLQILMLQQTLHRQRLRRPMQPMKQWILPEGVM